MKTLTHKWEFLAIRTLMLLLSVAVFGGQTVLASDFDWGNQCYTDTENGEHVQIDVIGRLLGSKSTVNYDTATVSAEVQNNTDEPQKVTLVTYQEFYEHTNYADVFDANGNLVQRGQDVFDYETVMVPPGTSTLTVDMPGCSTQIDLVCTDVIDYLGDGLYGNRKLAWYHAHQPNNGWCDDGIPDPECELLVAEITGITEGQVVTPGEILNIGANIDGGTPKKVRFELTDENGNLVEVESFNGPVTTWLEGASPYYFLGDGNDYGSGIPNGWDTTGHAVGQYTMTVSVYDNQGWNDGTPCDVQTVTFEIKDDSNPNVSCPVGTELIAKFEWDDNGYVFEKPAGNDNLISIDGDKTSGSWNSTTGIKVSDVILKGGTSTHTYEYSPAVTEGDFAKQDIPDNGGGNSPDISNIQFCGGCEPEYYAVHDDRLNDSQFLIVADEMVALGGVHYDRDIEALAIHPKTGVLYAASGDDTDKPGYLYTVDKSNGDLTDECDVVGYDEIDGLAFHPDGTLWGWVQDVGIIVIDIPIEGKTCTAKLVEPYAGEVEDLTWNVAGTMLYGVKNVNGNDPKEGNGDRTAKLLGYDGTDISLVCPLNGMLGSEIEAMETLPDDSLMVGFHGSNAVLVGKINIVGNTCSIEVGDEIPSIFNDVEGVTGRVCSAP